MVWTDVAVLPVQHLRLATRPPLEGINVLIPQVDLDPQDQLRHLTPAVDWGDVCQRLGASRS